MFDNDHDSQIHEFFFQPGTSVVTTLCALGAYFVDYGTPEEHKGWLVASGLLLLVTPWSFILMMPLNRELQETDKCLEKGK